MSSFPSVGKAVPDVTSPAIVIGTDGWPTDEESSKGAVSGGAIFEEFPALTAKTPPRSSGVRITFADKKVLDPVELRSWMLAHGADTALIDGRANGFMQKSGRHPGVGYLLMIAADFRAITNPRQPIHELKFIEDWEREDPGDPGEIETGTNEFTISNLCVTRVQAILPAVDGNEDDLPTRATDDTAFLLTIHDRRYYAQNGQGIRQSYNLLHAWGEVDSTTGGLDLGDTLAVLWNGYLRVFFGNVDLKFFGLSDWASVMPDPRELHFEGLSAWDAFFAVLDMYRLRFTLDHDGNPWVYQPSTTLPDETEWQAAAAAYRVDSRADDMQPWIPETIEVCCTSRDYQWWRKASQPYLTGTDMFRRYPTYKLSFDTATLEPTIETARIVPGTLTTIYAPHHAETDDEGNWFDEAVLEERLEQFGRAYLTHAIAGQWRDDLFSGCWAVRVGVYFTGVHWFDHGDGLLTRMISTPVDLDGEVEPTDFSDAPWAGEAVEHHNPALAGDRQPYHRSVFGQVVGSLYKATGTETVNQDEWAQVEVFSGHIRKPTVLWIARQFVRAINFGEAITVAEAVRVHCVWDWQLGRGGEWVITPGQGANSTPPPSANRVIVEMVFKDFDPPDPDTPDTFVVAGDRNYKEPVQWDNALTFGTHASITPDPANDEIEYGVGDWLIDVMAHVLPEDNQSSQSVYTAAGPLNGHPLICKCYIQLQSFNGTSWVTESNASHRSFIHYGTQESIFLRHVLRVESPDTSKRVRLVLGNFSDDSDDATVRLYHAKWWSQPLSG